MEKDKAENRRYARVKPVGLVSRTAKLVLDPRARAIDCRVVDISAGGACIELAEPLKLPGRFVFIHGGVKKSCHVVWQRNGRVGLGF
jgi:hypothetical protein